MSRGRGVLWDVAPFMTWVGNVRQRENSPSTGKLSGVSECHLHQQDTCSSPGLGLDLVAFSVLLWRETRALAPRWSIFPYTGWETCFPLALTLPTLSSRSEGPAAHRSATSVFLSTSKYSRARNKHVFTSAFVREHKVPFAFLSQLLENMNMPTIGFFICPKVR